MKEERLYKIFKLKLIQSGKMWKGWKSVVGYLKKENEKTKKEKTYI